MLFSGVPVVMIAQEIVVVPGVERGLEEHAHDLDVTHLPEAAVGGERFPPDDAKSSARHFLAQQVILGVEGLLVKASQLFEALAVKEHEHAGTEGLEQT